MADRKPCYTMDTMTIEQAVAQLPFIVLTPGRLPLTDTSDAQVEVCSMWPIVPGYFPRLMLHYLYPRRPGSVHVNQGLTDPAIDPAYLKSFRGAERFERGGRTFRAAAYVGGIMSLAFRAYNTHVVITTGSEMDQESMIEFALTFRRADSHSSRGDSLIA